MNNIIKTISTSIRRLNLSSSSITNSSFRSNSTSGTMGDSPRYTADYLHEKIKKELDADYVEIEDLSNCGCGMKFDALIVASKFDGKPILQRQRLVNQILADEMNHIHAFTMRTLTPEQWKNSKK